MVDISIIIVSYNTKKLLLDCLASIKKFTKGVSYEVIVVDNASTDGSAEAISGFRLIKNKTNLGFAKANNQGIRKAHGRYILLLNSDTKFLENTLGKMVRWLEAHPKIGVATCKLVNRQGSLQPTGGNFPDLFRIFLWATFLDDIPGVSFLFGSYHPHSFWYRGERQVDWVTGAFLMTRRQVFTKIGLLDEDFFMYGEDVEFCLRVKKAGFEVWYNPKTWILHFGGASARTGWSRIVPEFAGLVKIYQKHYFGWQLLILSFWLKIAAALRLIVFGILGGRKAREAYAKALVIP